MVFVEASFGESKHHWRLELLPQKEVCKSPGDYTALNCGLYCWYMLKVPTNGASATGSISEREVEAACYTKHQSMYELSLNAVNHCSAIIRRSVTNHFDMWCNQLKPLSHGNGKNQDLKSFYISNSSEKNVESIYILNSHILISPGSIWPEPLVLKKKRPRRRPQRSLLVVVTGTGQSTEKRTPGVYLEWKLWELIGGFRPVETYYIHIYIYIHIHFRSL